jgi:predicted nucleic acid-binding protein
LARDLGAGHLSAACDPEIGRLGGLYWRDHRHSHGTGLLDALIAATARLHDLRLMTRNVRHFPMLDDLLVPYQ